MCGWMRDALVLHVLGWGSACMCLGAGCGAGGGYEGRGVAPVPPFSAHGCGVCPGVGWDTAPPFLVGCPGGARGSGFCLYPAGLALAVWRVVRGVSFPWLGCVVALFGADGPSWALGACPILCGGPSLTSASPGGRCHLRWGVVLGSSWAAVLPPLFFSFSGLSIGGPAVRRSGGGVSLGGLVVGVACPRPPPPPSYAPFLFHPRGCWSASFLKGVCAGMSGVSLPLGLRRLRGRGGPLCVARRRQAWRGGLSVS